MPELSQVPSLSDDKSHIPFDNGAVVASSNCPRLRRERRTQSARLALALSALCGLSGCQPNLDLGSWTCAEDGSPNAPQDPTAPVALEWRAGFETQRFCDYLQVGGFCYPDADYPSLVTSLFHDEYHDGQHAAAFTVDTSASKMAQTRCVRQGQLPSSAYYGAWYYIPAPVTIVMGNWNLLHFRGGSVQDWADNQLAGFLDVSLINANGGLQLAVYGANYVPIGAQANYPPVPIGSWFHIQVEVTRAAGQTGEVALYQDGQQIFDATDVATDNSLVGQFYVGNLAQSLSPALSTVYVDDVTISATR